MIARDYGYDWHDTIPTAPAPLAAEAATDVGADDYDDAAPEGSAIVLLAAVVIVIACLGAVHLIAGVLQ